MPFFSESTSENLLFISRYSYIRSLSTRMQFWPSDLSFGSFEVIGGHIRFLPLTYYRIGRDRALWMVPMCLSRTDASTDMQSDLLGSARDLTRPWPEVKYWPDSSRSPCICFDAPCREDHDDARILPQAFLVRKVFAKKLFARNSYFAVFGPITPEPLKLAQIWWHGIERTAQEVSNVFFPQATS